jgi:hypothetical protein
VLQFSCTNALKDPTIFDPAAPQKNTRTANISTVGEIEVIVRIIENITTFFINFSSVIEPFLLAIRTPPET